MTTTSLLPHNKGSLTTRNPSTYRASHYGSMGRPSSGRRKSAVELLQESKAFYVKSESVLDTRQELRNTDHLHVRSPTVDVSSMHYRSLPGNGGGGGGGGSLIPFFPIGTCPPYPHHHYERYEHVQFKFSDLDRQKRHISKERKDLLAEDTLIPDSSGRPVLSMWSSIPPSKSDRRNITGYSTTGSTHNKNRSTRSATRRSTLPSGNFDLQQQQQQQQQHKQTDGVNGFLSGSKLMGLTLPFPVVLGQPEKNSRTFLRSSGMERHGASTLPMSSTSKVSHERNNAKPEAQPPPIPPRSPKAASKPVRPQDFPQMLPMQGIPPDILPPAPPRRLMSHENDLHQEGNIQSKLRRLLQDGPGRIHKSDDVNLVPITLPSPILPPTPPPDVTLESPMSDSGPIISPPPAFSTPVTPMLDRQNSSASEKSSQRHDPNSTAMSMVSVSISSVSSGRKSIPSLSDVPTNHYSPSPYSRSSSSPMSPDDITRPDDNDDDDDDDDDDQSSEKEASISNIIPNNNFQKKNPIPKSITENTLHKMGNAEPPPIIRLPPTSSEASAVRRPILRSKSDLSHRYIKSGNTANLLGGGFTLVHVDLGLPSAPPPLPPHQNNLTNSLSYHHHGKMDEGDIKKQSTHVSPELERFFDKLGLDNGTQPAGTGTTGGNNGGHGSGSSSPVFFSSVSSVDSGPRRCGSVDSGDSPIGVKIGSRTVGGSGYTAPVTTSYSSSSIVIKHGEPSIVERNARVIKWLFNCRKAADKR